ncbi:MAG: LacI family DNA-binding transcriptional regulator [Lachnospiraceae bacterium]|nr:LacI family DNA-binding transcriptional regulator [Lachnospiraceae bacterium]
MAISAKELAQILNLSPAAVSMALNNKPGISEKTREMVIAAANQYGCHLTRKQESSLGKSIRFVIYKQHGEIVSDTPFFSQMTEGINTGCRNAGYELKVSYFYEHENRDEQIRALADTNCKGMILLGTEMSREFFQPFSQLKIPMVVLDTYFEELDCDSVLINNVHGAYMATNYLIENGHKTIGYLRSASQIGNFAERADGYYKALRHHKIHTDHPYVHRLTPSMEGAYADMKHILAADPEIADAYFADNDLIAAGAIRAFKEFGLTIPDDVSIIGFDDLPICEFLEPSLTTMAVPKQYMGELAVERLIGKMNQQTPVFIKTEVSAQLKVRESVKKAE